MAWTRATGDACDRRQEGTALEESDQGIMDLGTQARIREG
jgi:hypothetical protein